MTAWMIRSTDLENRPVKMKHLAFLDIVLGISENRPVPARFRTFLEFLNSSEILGQFQPGSRNLGFQGSKMMNWRTFQILAKNLDFSVRLGPNLFRREILQNVWKNRTFQGKIFGQIYEKIGFFKLFDTKWGKISKNLHEKLNFLQEILKNIPFFRKFCQISRRNSIFFQQFCQISFFFSKNSKNLNEKI